MSDVKIVLNKAGVRELLRSDEVQEACKEYADKVLAQAGDGYVEEERDYPERKGYAVRADSAKAVYDNLKNNTLLRALQ